MRVTFARVLSVLLAGCAIVFGVLAMFGSVREVQIYTSWPMVDATVDNVTPSSSGGRDHAILTVILRYGLGRHAWAVRSFFLETRGEKFTGDYAAGTHHSVRIDPTNPEDCGSGGRLESRDTVCTAVLWCLLRGLAVRRSILLAIS